MRTSDVRIGETYLCRIGSKLSQVIVTARHTSKPNTSGRKRPDVFCVRKVGTTIDLPKHRSAAALRPRPESPPAKPCFFCHEINGHTLECYQAQYEPYADKVKKHLDPPEETIDTASPRSNPIPQYQICIRCGAKCNTETYTSYYGLCDKCSIIVDHHQKESTAKKIAIEQKLASGAIPISSLKKLENLSTEEYEEFANASPPSELCRQAYINAAKAAQAAGCSLEEIEKAGEQAFDRQSNGELIAQGYLPCTPPCLVSQEYYLSAAENGVGWCTKCKMFRGEDLRANSEKRECPECHQHTLYGAEFALCEGYIDLIEDK